MSEGLSLSGGEVEEDQEEEVEVSLWQAVEPLSSGLPDSEPAGRCGHVAVASGGGQRLVVIGGYTADGILNDVWEFDLNTREWTRINVAPGPAPPERAYSRGCAGPPPGADERREGEAFAYLFGGTDAEGNASNDLWCLDVENRTWHEAHRGAGATGRGSPMPCGRSNHSMCRMGGVLAVHGGESASGALLDDLWLFHPASSSWSGNYNSSTGPRPCARSSHCLAYAKRSVERSSAEGNSATAVAAAMAGSLVLFGGLGHDEGGGDSDAEEAMPLNDLWVWSPVPATGAGGGAAGLGGAVAVDDGESICPRLWSLVMLDGVGPSPRSLAALTPGSSCGELFLFGGYGLVELPAPAGSGDGGELVAEGEEEGGDIIMAYIDDLWRLKLGGGVTGGSGDSGIGSSSSRNGAISSSAGWTDEEGMGFPGDSIVEGRNGHTLTVCGAKLVLFGGFVGDGFDAGVHVAEAPLSS